MNHSVDPNVFETANAGFAQALYEDYLRDPNAVTEEWRRLFESGRVGEKADGRADGRSAPTPRHPECSEGSCWPGMGTYPDEVSRCARDDAVVYLTV